MKNIAMHSAVDVKASGVIFSIKPKFVNMILTGEKKYEYRKIVCKRKVHKALIYATAPISRVVGEFQIIEVFEDNPESIWNRTKSGAGISKSDYDSYFLNCKLAVAYHIGDVKKYKESRELKEFGIDFVPQSFTYYYD